MEQEMKNVEKGNKKENKNHKSITCLLCSLAYLFAELIKEYLGICESTHSVCLMSNMLSESRKQ
jgi:hypothetical protein